MIRYEIQGFVRAVLFALTIALAAVIAQTEVEHSEMQTAGAACAVPVDAADE